MSCKVNGIGKSIDHAVDPKTGCIEAEVRHFTTFAVYQVDMKKAEASVVTSSC